MGRFNLWIDRVLFTLPAESQAWFQLGGLDTAKAAFCHWFCAEILWREFLGTVAWLAEGVGFSVIQSLLLTDDMAQLASSSSDLKCPGHVAEIIDP